MVKKEGDIRLNERFVLIPTWENGFGRDINGNWLEFDSEAAYRTWFYSRYNEWLKWA